MKIRLAGVGKPRDADCGVLHERYVRRLAAFRVDYRECWVDEVRPGGRFSEDHVREREGRALRRALEPRSTVVALDPAGILLDSPELAERLQRWASPRVTFVVGGPLGLDRGLVDDANARWSLSPLTFPHELVRVLLVEQLYRALTILRRVPYHK